MPLRIALAAAVIVLAAVLGMVTRVYPAYGGGVALAVGSASCHSGYDHGFYWCSAD